MVDFGVCVEPPKPSCPIGWTDLGQFGLVCPQHEIKPLIIDLTPGN